MLLYIPQPEFDLVKTIDRHSAMEFLSFGGRIEFGHIVRSQKMLAWFPAPATIFIHVGVHASLEAETILERDFDAGFRRK